VSDQNRNDSQYLPASVSNIREQFRNASVKPGHREYEHECWNRVTGAADLGVSAAPGL
jgi:hypothetical protein